MNVYDSDELTDDNNEPEYKFILVNDQTGERLYDLDTIFVRDNGCDVNGWRDCPDSLSIESASTEALQLLGYSVKVVKK